MGTTRPTELNVSLGHVLGSFITIFFQQHSLKRPVYLILVFLVIHFALADLGYWVGFFLESSYNDSYEELVINYDGIGKLLERLFRLRDHFIDPVYIINNYWLPTLFCFLALLLFKFRNQITSQISPGKTRDSAQNILKFLETPNQIVFYLFIILILWATNDFFSGLHSSYQIGINRKLSKELNSYAEKRADHFSEKLALPQSKPFDLKKQIDTPNLRRVVCTFYSQPKYLGIFSISYPDFIFNIFFPDNSRIKTLEKKIHKLPKSLEIIFDDSVTDLFRIELSKETYSKEEVVQLLKQKEDNLKLQLDLNEYKKTQDTQNEYLKVEAENQFYRLNYISGNDADPINLGQIDLHCSQNSRDVTRYHSLQMLNGLFN